MKAETWSYVLGGVCIYSRGEDKNLTMPYENHQTVQNQNPSYKIY